MCYEFLSPFCFKWWKLISRIVIPSSLFLSLFSFTSSLCLSLFAALLVWAVLELALNNDVYKHTRCCTSALAPLPLASQANIYCHVAHLHHRCTMPVISLFRLFLEFVFFPVLAAALLPPLLVLSPPSRKITCVCVVAQFTVYLPRLRGCFMLCLLPIVAACVRISLIKGCH